MRILLIEDHTQLARPTARELTNEYGHTVISVSDPIRARRVLEHGEQFDVAIVDLLFDHLTRAFDERRDGRNVVLSRDELLITGLDAIVTFRNTVPNGGVVLWTSAEGGRRLHVLFAYESLGVRAFCSKSSGTGKADALNRAVIAAAKGETEIDPVIAPYLPPPGAQKVGDALLKEPIKRAIWRALSLRAYTRAEIADITGYSVRTIGNTIPSMRDDLIRFDSGLKRGPSPLGDVSGYAGNNWQFFLDEAVRKQYD